MTWAQDVSSANDAHGFIQPGLPSVALAPLCNGLGALNAKVAEELLALAKVLQSNSVSARQITAESHKATGSDGNAQSSHSIEALQGVLAGSAGINKMVEVSAAKMLEILSQVNAARAPLQRLIQMHSLLQTVGVLSRIECGRITNTSEDLSNLSKDIDVLAKEVQQHLNEISNDSSRLSAVLRNGVRELHRFEQHESVEVGDLIRPTQAVLSPMIARIEALQEAAQNIDAQYATFHSSTDKIVMSLQNEDIARQRVEHVQEAIRRVGTALDAGESVGSCAGVLSLQRAQLAGTRDLLADSVRTIHSGMQSLGPRIQELVSQTATLAQQTDEAGQLLAVVIDGELESVTEVFKQCSSSLAAAVAVVNSVVSSVEKMTNGACALSEIAAFIRLISLNARVTTSHLGSEGLAMGAIASELSAITNSGKMDIRIVLDILAAINDALAKITSEQALSGDSLMMTGGGDVVGSELSRLSQSVKASRQETAAKFNQVMQLAKALCSELELGCDLALHAQSITELFDEQLRSFDEVFGKLGYSEEMSAVGASCKEAGDLSNLYSMESERKLHTRVFGGDASDAENQEGGESSGDVELF